MKREILIAVVAVVVLILIMLFVNQPVGAQTLNGIVYDDSTKQVLMVVVPDGDYELDDPAYNPSGSVMVRISKTAYGAEPSTRQLYLDVLPVEVAHANLTPLYTPEEAAAFNLDAWTGLSTLPPVDPAVQP